MNYTSEYDVAFSFAGTDREVARIIAAIGIANGLRVFIDEHHISEAWGKNLNEYLGELYDHKARFCLILISKEYCEKAYTNLERRRALDRALESKVEYILPVRLDDSWLDGLPRATAYLDLRQMTPIEVGKAMVRKIKGDDVEVAVPEGIATAKVVPLTPNSIVTAELRGARPDQPIDFVAIRVADECQAWKTAEPRKDLGGLVFRGGFGWYEDPIFDITLMNPRAEPILLTAVGIEAILLSCEGVMNLGGGGAEPVNLHRTYKLQLPDLWQALAEKQRELGADRSKPVAVEERALCRLPDPILLEGYRPYRFALHLFDFVLYCPTEVQLFFWARTNRGEARSELARLSYVIGSFIPPLARYYRLLDGEAAVELQQRNALKYLRPEERERKLQRVAYELWERAGRPHGRDQEFWTNAEQELAARLLAENDLRSVHKRPLELAGGAR
jgi:TIR domain/Protein of unknown function (DUF2934)